jgi:hypothetical protein
MELHVLIGTKRGNNFSLCFSNLIRRNLLLTDNVTASSYFYELLPCNNKCVSSLLRNSPRHQQPCIHGILSSGHFPGVWILKVDVSEHSVGSIFTPNHLWIWNRRSVPETSDFNIQTPGKCPEDNIPYLKHGESLKTTTMYF